jgi:hypothetical protein
VSAERIEALLDGSLPKEEVEALLARLPSDAALRADLATALRLHGLLQAAADPDADAGRLADVVARALGPGGFEARVMDGLRARSRRRGVGLAAAAVLAAGLAWLLWPGPELRLVAGQGAVVLRGASRLEGPTALRAFDRVQASGWASLRWTNGTVVELGPGASVEVVDARRLRLRLGRLSAEVARPMTIEAPHATAEIKGTSLVLTATPDATELRVRSGMVAFGGTEVGAGRRARAANGRVDVEPAGREALRRLGASTFQLGVMSGLGEKWIEEVREQGARFDLRYQHLAWNWTSWNAGRGFAALYLEESKRLGVVPVFSYYALARAAAPISATAGDAAAMGRYWADLKRFLAAAAAHGGPVVLHVEPGLWESPLVPRIAVGASGVDGLPDTLAGFARAVGLLRDRLAPNVLLAGHATRQGEAWRGGPWDLLFTDLGDRDAGWRESKGEKGAWWSDADFEALRAWGASVHAETGLSLFAWRLPLGNRVMAACNDTPWHYMDNKVEHFLEGYPANRRIAEWAQAGFAGLLFGGGTVECTVHLDNAKDGVTNPPPAPGNRGERAPYPDDDGGYLRLRAGAYYASGPYPLPR